MNRLEIIALLFSPLLALFRWKEESVVEHPNGSKIYYLHERDQFGMQSYISLYDREFKGARANPNVGDRRYHSYFKGTYLEYDGVAWVINQNRVISINA